MNWDVSRWFCPHAATRCWFNMSRQQHPHSKCLCVSSAVVFAPLPTACSICQSRHVCVTDNVHILTGGHQQLVVSALWNLNAECAGNRSEWTSLKYTTADGHVFSFQSRLSTWSKSPDLPPETVSVPPRTSFSRVFYPHEPVRSDLHVSGGCDPTTGLLEFVLRLKKKKKTTGVILGATPGHVSGIKVQEVRGLGSFYTRGCSSSHGFKMVGQISSLLVLFKVSSCYKESFSCHCCSFEGRFL